MALGEIVKRMTGGKRRAWVSKRTKAGRLQGRFCVGVEADKAPRSAVKGVKLKPVQYRGCYVSKNKALAVADRLAKVATLPKGRKSRRRSRR